jgi:hypothetical protein
VIFIKNGDVQWRFIDAINIQPTATSVNTTAEGLKRDATKADVLELFVLGNVVLIKNRVFWDVTPCPLVARYRHLEGACCSFLRQG